MKLREIKEQVMSSAVGTNVLHHGALISLVRRPMMGHGLISFSGLKKKKKKKKRKKNEI